MNEKVLIVIESLAQGGAETVAVNLANGLAKRGKTVCVCAATGPLRPRLAPGISFVELPRFGFPALARILMRLRGVVKSFKPDIIHSQNATHGLLIRLLFLFRAHPRCVFTYHSTRTERMPDLFSGLVFNFIADKIIAIAEHRRRSLLKAGVKPGKLYSVPNFINAGDWKSKKISFDRRLFRQEAGLGAYDAVLLISARLIPAKNVDLFLRIVNEVRKTGSNVAGIVLGDGPEMPDLKNTARLLGLGERVLFTGFSEDVSRYYFASDIFVFPSRHREVLPMALIEACASGLPIICSDIPGNDEIVRNGENGFLLSGAERDYSERIISLLNDPVLYGKFSENAVSLAQNLFGEEVCIAKILKIYDEQ